MASYDKKRRKRIRTQAFGGPSLTGNRLGSERFIITTTTTTTTTSAGIRVFCRWFLLSEWYFASIGDTLEMCVLRIRKKQKKEEKVKQNILSLFRHK